jgi:hypothetical protein
VESSLVSAGIDRERIAQAHPQRPQQVDCRPNRMGPPMQIPQPIQALDGQRQRREEPGDQQTVRLMVTEVLQPVAGLGIGADAGWALAKDMRRNWPRPRCWRKNQRYSTLATRAKKLRLRIGGPRR